MRIQDRESVLPALAVLFRTRPLKPPRPKAFSTRSRVPFYPSAMGSIKSFCQIEKRHRLPLIVATIHTRVGFKDYLVTPP